MAKEQKNPGHQVILLSIFIFWIAGDIWELWVVAGVMLVIGISVTIVYAMKHQQSVSQQTAQGIEQLLPTSKGVAWLEFVTERMDNPDTAVQPVGAQPEGSDWSLEGVSATEFGDAYDSEEFVRGVSGEEFVSKGIPQFAEHFDSSPVPRSWYDPVSEWYDPVSAWYDPFR